MEANGLQQRVNTLEAEMQIQRGRSHDYGNKLVEQGSHIEDARTDIKELRDEMNARFSEQNRKIDSRFDKLTAQGWKIAGFVILVLSAAATVAGVFLH